MLLTPKAGKSEIINLNFLKSFFFILLLFSFRSIAQRNIQLHLINSEGIPFIMELDGKKINAAAQASLSINHLDSREYQVQIFFPDNSVNVKGKIYTIWEGLPTDNREFTYTIEKTNNKWRIRFLNSSPIETKTDSATEIKTDKKDSSVFLNEKAFSNYLAIINLEPFEDSRLHKCEEFFSKSCLTIQQITEICSVFEYDQSKLNFIRLAFQNSKEKSNFHKLQSVFQYRNTKSEFSKWLEGAKNQ